MGRNSNTLRWINRAGAYSAATRRTRLCTSFVPHTTVCFLHLRHIVASTNIIVYYYYFRQMFACQTSLCQDRRNDVLIIWKSSKGYLYISEANIVVPLFPKVFTRTNDEPLKNHLTNFFPEVTVLWILIVSPRWIKRNGTARKYLTLRNIMTAYVQFRQSPTHSKLTRSESILVACRCCTCCYPPTAGCLLPRDKILTC